MIEVYCERDGRIARRCRSVWEADRLVMELDEMHAWIDGETFNWGTDEGSNSGNKERTITKLCTTNDAITRRAVSV